MANQKQLDLLLSGKTRWDNWRRVYPDVQAVEPDLHDADLHGGYLVGREMTRQGSGRAISVTLFGTDERSSSTEGPVRSVEICGDRQARLGAWPFQQAAGSSG